MIRSFYWKLKSLQKVIYKNNTSKLLLSSHVILKTKEGSEIQLFDDLKCGFNLTKSQVFPHYKKTIISLGKNAKLIIKGKVTIAPGTAINIGDNATLTFNGNNTIAHNSLIICNCNSVVGKNTATSWNVTLIDDDLHDFYFSNGRKLKNIRKGFKIGDNVGIQMNAVMPKAKTIGDNSIIAANTVIRKNVPANSLAYQNTELTIKDNITTGFKYLYER